MKNRACTFDSEEAETFIEEVDEMIELCEFFKLNHLPQYAERFRGAYYNKVKRLATHANCVVPHWSIKITVFFFLLTERTNQKMDSAKLGMLKF